MRTLKSTLILLFTGMTLATSAQDEPLNFSLEEAVNYGLENNRTLQNARTSVNVQQEGVNEALSGILPQVDAKLDYMTYFGYELDFAVGGSSSGYTQEQILDAYNQTISNPQFSNWSANDLNNYFASQVFASNLAGPTSIKMTDQLMGNLQVGQLIFNGQFFIGLQTAKLAKHLAEQNVVNVELDVKENITNSYYLVLISEETVKIIEQNVTNLQKILERTKGMAKAGVAEQTDVDQLQMQLTMLENTRRSMDRTIQLNYNLLRFQLGTAPNANIQLSQSLSDFLENNPELMNTNIAFVLENNIGYQLAASQTEMADKMVSMEKWSYGPTVTGFYSYNAKILTSGFDMNPNHAAGATISLPVFAGGERRAKVNKAQLELEKAQNDQQMMVDQLSLQEKQLRFELQNALENYLSQKENVQVAKRVYDSMDRKFTHGMATSLDLTNANNNYLQAESNFLQSQLTLLQAQMNLKKLANTL